MGKLIDSKGTVGVYPRVACIIQHRKGIGQKKYIHTMAISDSFGYITDSDFFLVVRSGELLLCMKITVQHKRAVDKKAYTWTFLDSFGHMGNSCISPFFYLFLKYFQKFKEAKKRDKK